jgi:hypothetical protein
MCFGVGGGRTGNGRGPLRVRMIYSSCPPHLPLLLPHLLSERHGELRELVEGLRAIQQDAFEQLEQEGAGRRGAPACSRRRSERGEKCGDCMKSVIYSM